MSKFTRKLKTDRTTRHRKMAASRTSRKAKTARVSKRLRTKGAVARAAQKKGPDSAFGSGLADWATKKR